MKRILFLSVLICLICIFCFNVWAEGKIKLHFFYSPNCKHCIKIKKDFLPKIIAKYKDKMEVEYLNIKEEKNFKLYLAVENKFKVKARVPSILVGKYFLVGSEMITKDLEAIIQYYLKYPFETIEQVKLDNLLDKFISFSPLAIVFAGLIDGINPCAFTVLIFFISFLTLMGYRKRDLALIGIIFIFSVFLTYLAIGLGLFRGLYELRNFYTFLRITYYIIAALCFILAYLNLKDFFTYIKTKNTDLLKVKLPSPVRRRINAIISKFYRRESQNPTLNRLELVASTFLVGFIVSLLEAVCTGQVYLPTVVFILKDPLLHLKAIFYLLLYNLMFIAPLFLILLFAVWGVTSKQLEKLFRENIALVKIFMSILFLVLGIFLILGV